MKKAVSFIFIIMAGIAAGGQAQSVYSLSDSVAASAANDYIRPTDITARDIRWNRASSDLFTYRLDSGLYGFYGPQPTVFIDGLPIDANFFGWQNLNMLPVDSFQRVEYSFEPQTYRGSLAPAGFINFQPAPVDSGLSATASFYLGNETGDPGPYNYDSTKVTPNIDRWGPDGSVSLAYRKLGWHSRAAFVFHNHRPTDLTLNSRLHYTASLLGTNKRYVNHPIYEATRSGVLETGYDTQSWHFKARTAFGVNKDYVFLQPFGREIPAKTSYGQIAVRGSYQTGDWTLSGRYTGHKKNINKRIQLHPYIFDWHQTRHTIALSSAYSSHAFSVKPGITYERLLTKAPGLGTVPNDLATIFLNASLFPHAKSTVNIRLNVDYDEKNTAKTYGIGFPYQPANGWTINPSITYTEVLPLRQNAFSYWVNRGYTFADALGISYAGNTAVDKNRLTIFKLQNKIALSPQFVLTLNQQLLTHESLNVPFQQVQPREFTTDTQPGPFSISQEKGSRLELFSKLTQKIKGIIEQSLALNIQRTLSGSPRYENYFEQIPDTKLQYTIDAYPTRTLVLSLNALYRSSTNWNEFKAIDGNKYHLPNGIPIRDVTGTFHSRTPAFTNFSVSIQKWLWNRRLNMQFSVRNLLNDTVRMHPLGGELATKFDIKVGFKF